MAKLGAHGYELARVVREALFADESQNELVSWERRTLALMSDGYVLVKDDVRFWPERYDTEAEKRAGGRFHSYGWKRGKRVGWPRDRFVAWAEARGYREV